MVLGDLSKQLTAALSKLNSTTIIDEDVLNQVLKEIASALLLADVSIQIVARIRENVRNKCNPDSLPSGTNIQKHIKKVVFDELCKMLTTEAKPYRPQKGKPNVFLFVGLQGAGKTTTVAKFAYYYKQRGYKTAMVCADTFRAGAFDQLKQNATRIKVPFYGSYIESDPVKIAAEGVTQFREEGYEIILVDSSGRHKQEADLFEEMEQVLEAVEANEVIFVVDSSIGVSISEQASAFKKSVPIGSVIITKLDGHAKGGGALTAVAATGSPITFIGVGEHFDELEKFEPDGFVSRLLGMGDMKALFESFKEKTDIFEKGPEMMEKFQKGEFTFRDLRDQLQNVMKVGTVGQFMSMIPGLSNLNIPGMTGKEGNARLQRFMVIMDSMTNDELDCIFKSRKRGKDGKWTVTMEKTMSESRIIRIAKGSGCNPQEVMMIIEQQKQMVSMMQKMGKTGLMKDNNKELKRNPNQVLQQLQKSMDPNLLQKLGGAGNMMDIMKQMEGIEGMQELMKQFGGGRGMGGMGGPSGGGGRGAGKRR